MSAQPTRFSVGYSDLGVSFDPDEAGDLVRYADVEEALQDKDRLEWLLPVIAGTPDDKVGYHRALALAAGVTRGLTGRTLVDWAREGSP